MAFFFPQFVYLLLFQLPLFTYAQTSSNTTLGSSLSTSDRTPYWTSPSGDFAFGFRPHQGLFLLAIWFAKIPVETIVWTANEGNPVERGSEVWLTPRGVLSLRTPNGTEIWNARATDDSQVAHAAMLDMGNFVLTSTESTTVWASFDNPTDTILPSQNVEIGRELRSRLAENDYRNGRFRFVLQDDGNLIMYSIALRTYGNNQPYWKNDTFSTGSQLIFNQSGYIYLSLKSGQIINLPSSSQTPSPTGNIYQRATIDYDGVFRQYTYPRTVPSNGWPVSWSISGSIPEKICEAAFGDSGSGVCGFNSYCRLDENGRAQCLCPTGYTYLDPDNAFAGCKQNFLPQICGTNGSNISDGFEMKELQSINWPLGNYEKLPEMSLEQCSETCLNDCFCAVAIFGTSTTCWLKKYPVTRGRRELGNTSTKALIKVGNSSPENVPPTIVNKKNENETKWIIPGSIGLGTSVVLNLVLLSMILYVFSRKNKTQPQKNMHHSGGVNLQSFTYTELEEATDQFKEVLGKGAFSTVYKGALTSGLLVAVKRLNKEVQGNDKEFKTEMNAIGKTNHKNLVRLLGFCDEDSHRILVYEFMRNGSLEKFLFGNAMLTWGQRMEITLGIARGLAYLHEDCSSQIIHCDIKPQNILVDDSYVARISDFGLAKLLKNEQTRTTTGVRGTRGYVAPEWFRSMAITAKVDVYSFGIMLLEIVCCRKNVELEVGQEEVELLSDLVYECCAQKSLDLLVENDEEAKNDVMNLERLLLVALWCIRYDPSLRPSMKKVIHMLEGVVDVPMPTNDASFVSSIA